MNMVDQKIKRITKTKIKTKTDFGTWIDDWEYKEEEVFVYEEGNII